MEIRTCPRCKKIFQYITGAPICTECKEKDEKDFARVKEYLKENPKTVLSQVAEELDISIERITKYLKEGRLEVAPSSGITIECEKCGKPITTGRYCKACSGQLESDLKGTYNELARDREASSSSLIRFLKEDEENK